MKGIKRKRKEPISRIYPVFDDKLIDAEISRLQGKISIKDL